MFPSILCAAVYTGQTKKLELLKNRYEADLSAADYDGRTPLHIAASEGNYIFEIYKYSVKEPLV